MKERPILFSAPMVKAILAGRKTVTRRIVTVPWKGSRRALPYGPWWVGEDGKLLAMDEAGDYHHAEQCLAGYGEAGDRLWVRETFAANVPGCEAQGGISYRADHVDPKGDGPANPMRWTPSIFMRRHQSRITLEVLSSHVERLHAITEDDARAEGVKHAAIDGVLTRTSRHGEVLDGNYRDDFAVLWDEINGKRAAWSSNPWVWRVEFRPLVSDWRTK